MTHLHAWPLLAAGILALIPSCTTDMYGNTAVTPGGAVALGLGAAAVGAAIASESDNNNYRPGPPPPPPRPQQGPRPYGYRR